METWVGDTGGEGREGAGHSGLEELGVQWTGDKHPGPLLSNLAGLANRSEEGGNDHQKVIYCCCCCCCFFGENG